MSATVGKNPYEPLVRIESPKTYLLVIEIVCDSPFARAASRRTAAASLFVTDTGIVYDNRPSMTQENEVEGLGKAPTVARSVVYIYATRGR